MNHKKKRHSKNDSNTQKSSKPADYKVGKFVFFNAYADSSDQSTYFMCQGCVTRQPTLASKVYKITVTAVDPQSFMCGNRPDLAKSLLGRKIAREPGQILEKPTSILKPVYREEDWLFLSDMALIKLGRSLKKR